MLVRCICEQQTVIVLEDVMRSEFLPFSTPTLEDAEINEVVDSLRSGWITTGPKVKRFEVTQGPKGKQASNIQAA